MQNLNNLSISSLRTVEVLARHSSMRSAAEELGVTVGALSQRLAKTEAALQQTLFVRSSTGLQPTDICKEIAPRLTSAFRELSSIVSDIRDNNQNTLTVTVATIIASRWLIWRIKKFTDQNPHISLRILPTNDVVDLENSEVDIGIRVGARFGSDDGVTKLMDKHVFPVCSPDIAAQIKTPADILKFPIIRENDEFIGWKPWLAEVGLSGQDLIPGPTYADGSLCLDAAMTGQGIFMAWEIVACDALERGLVSSPFDIRSDLGSSYWFACSKRSMRNPSVRKFKSWLMDELECSLAHWNKQSDG